MATATSNKQATTPQTNTTNGLAVASFVLSIVGLGIIGFIMGIVALSQIKKSSQNGRGLAIAGIIIGVITGLISITVFTSDSPAQKTNINVPLPTKVESNVPSEPQKNTPPTPAESKPEAGPTPSETVSQKNAVRSAKSYLDFSAFSHDGLVAQLEYEQFSHADAVYGADNSGADWNEQAAKSAKQYMEYSSFSRGSLIDQLLYEKFTQAQAEYGVNAVGL